MKREQLLDAIGFINDEAVRDAKAYQSPKRHYGSRVFVIEIGRAHV